MEKYMNLPVLIGFLNPPGEPDDKNTTYFTKSQLEKLNRKFNDHRHGKVHLYINHKTKDKDGKPYEPSGEVISSTIDKEGRLKIAAIVYDNHNGKLAQKFINDKNMPMRDFSMGYEVLMKDLGDEGYQKIDNIIKEVSICYRGAREGTRIGYVTSLAEIAKIGEKKLSGAQLNINNNNEKKNHSDNSKTETTKTSQNKKMDFELTANSDFMLGTGNISQMNFFDMNSAMKNAVNNFMNTDYRGNQHQALTANASMDVEESTAPGDNTSYGKQYQTGATSTSSSQNTNVNSDKLIDDLINQFRSKEPDRENAELEEYRKTLKEIAKNRERNIDVEIPLPESSLAKRLGMEAEALRAQRPPITADLPDKVREYMEQDYRLKDMAIAEEHERRIKEDNMARNEMQRKVKNVLGGLLKTSENNNTVFSEDNARSVATLISKAGELGPKVQEGVLKLFDALAANDEASVNAANKVQDIFTKYQGARQVILKLNEEIQQTKEENDKLKRDYETLANRAPINTREYKESHKLKQIEGVKKVKVEASYDPGVSSNQGGFYIPEKLNRYGETMLAVRLMHAKETPDDTKKFTLFTNQIFENPNIDKYDLMGALIKHKEKLENNAIYG